MLSSAASVNRKVRSCTLNASRSGFMLDETESASRDYLGVYGAVERWLDSIQIGSSDILLHQVQPILRPISRAGLVTFTAFNEFNGAQSRGSFSTAIENCAVFNPPASFFAKLLRRSKDGYSDNNSSQLPVACPLHAPWLICHHHLTTDTTGINILHHFVRLLGDVPDRYHIWYQIEIATAKRIYLQ